LNNRWSEKNENTVEFLILTSFKPFFQAILASFSGITQILGRIVLMLFLEKEKFKKKLHNKEIFSTKRL
jgi:hypothetical protein